MPVCITSIYTYNVHVHHVSIYHVSVHQVTVYHVTIYNVSIHVNSHLVIRTHLTFLTAASCSGLTLSAGKILKKYSGSVNGTFYTLFCTIWRPREVHISLQFDKIILQYSAVTSLQLRKSQEYGADTKWLAYVTPAGPAVSLYCC